MHNTEETDNLALDLDTELDEEQEIATWTAFWRMLIKTEDYNTALPGEDLSLADTLNSAMKYAYFMLVLLSRWYNEHGWPDLDSEHHLASANAYSDEEFSNIDMAEQVDVAADSIPSKRLLTACLSTIAKHQMPAAVPLLLECLSTIKEVENIEYWIDLFKISAMSCIDLENFPMEDFTELSAHGGRSDLLSIRLTPIQIMRIILLHRPEYVMTGVQFAKNVLSSILQVREGRLTENDDIVIEEALFGLARSAPMEADALCSKYGPKLSAGSREKIKAWQKGKLHMCNSDLQRDHDNLFGILEQGVLYLDHWKAAGDCHDHDHHGHDHHHHH